MEETCNSDETADEITLVLTQPFRFSWLRIEVDGEVRNFDFKIALDTSTEMCRHQRNFYVTNSTVDVICDSTPLFTNITIKGGVASIVCSIYISGGRNVALKQETNQSSTEDNYVASIAVDGMKSADTSDEVCATAANRSIANWWYLSFSRPQQIYRVVVDTSLDRFNQLEEFDLMTFSEAGNRINRYLNATTTDHVFNIILESPRLSISLIIESHPNTILTLCEVEVFGETICPDGTYGLDCEQKCNCQSDQSCSVVTGACSEGCPGFYGPECDTPCRSSCADNLCLQRSGDCIDCLPGYSGALCTEECPRGTFGKKCSYLCPDVCEDRLCHNVHGECLKCKGSLTGPNCIAPINIDISVMVTVICVLALVLSPLCCIIYTYRHPESTTKPAVEGGKH